MNDDQKIARLERYFRDPIVGEGLLQAGVSNCEACRNIRIALRFLGFNVVDSKEYDSELEAAITDFQDKYDHEFKDGVFGPGTRKLLTEQLINRAGERLFRSMKHPDAHPVPRIPQQRTTDKFAVSSDGLLTVNGEEWEDTYIHDGAPELSGRFWGSSIDKLTSLTFAELAGFLDELEISLPGAQKEYDEWEFAYLEASLSGIHEKESVKLEFRIEYDLEFWAKSYSISDIASMIEHVLEDDIKPFSYWQRDQNTTIEGFGVSLVVPSTSTIGEALDKEVELRKVEKEIKSQLPESTGPGLNLVFDFPPAIKSACEQYLLYFAQFLSDLGIEARAEVKEQATRVLFSVVPNDEKQALEQIREALQLYLGLPLAPAFPSGQLRDVAVSQLEANILHLQSQIMLAKAAIEMKNATIAAQNTQIALLQERMNLAEFQPQRQRAEARDKEEVVKGVLAVKKYDFKFIEVDFPELLRRLKRKF